MLSSSSLSLSLSLWPHDYEHHHRRCYAAAIGALRGGAPRAWQQALAHYHRMESKGVETSPEACTKLAEVFAESGQALQALQTLTGCKASGVRVIGLNP